MDSLVEASNGTCCSRVLSFEAWLVIACTQVVQRSLLVGKSKANFKPLEIHPIVQTQSTLQFMVITIVCSCYSYVNSKL